MTRALVVCLLAITLIQPAAAGTGPSQVEQTLNRSHFLDAISLDALKEAMAPWMRANAYFSNSATRVGRTTLASFSSATGKFSQCAQKLALGGPDTRCVLGCDAAKESCDRQCGSVRATCLSQCPGLGFACDYYCQAAHLVCRANCGRSRDACVSSCPPKGGEKES